MSLRLLLALLTLLALSAVLVLNLMGAAATGQTWHGDQISHIIPNADGSLRLNGKTRQWRTSTDGRVLASDTSVACLGAATGAPGQDGFWRIQADQVERLAADGTVSWRIPVPTECGTIIGCCGTEERIYLGDAEHKCIWRLDRTGQVLGAIPGIMPPPGRVPMGCDGAGRLYVANAGRHCVQIFDPEGKLLAKHGNDPREVDGYGGCCNPIGIWVLDDGRYITTEQNPPRVRLISPAGTTIRQLTWPHEIQGKEDTICASGCSAYGGLSPIVTAQRQVVVLDHELYHLFDMGPLEPSAP